MSRLPLRGLIRESTDALAAAGVPSPRSDAELLAAHVLGVERGRLVLVPMVEEGDAGRLRRLVARRAAREPLQHLLGWVAMGDVQVAVGPGVFVPRPETELLFAWALAFLEAHPPRPVVVDLCSGSGVLALAVANARPDAQVHAVEADPAAAAWARRNIDQQAGQGDTPVTLHQADVTDPGLLPGLAGGVDLVVANPPYVPSGTAVDPEVARDPARAVFAGPDGLEVIRPMLATVTRLLRPGGGVGVEHDDSHGQEVPRLLAAAGFAAVACHRDLAGRPRFTVGVLPG